MALLTSAGVTSTSIISILALIVAGYLFSIGLINLSLFILILTAFIILLLISIYQDIKDQLNDQKEEQKKLNERLKIYEQLINIKSDIEVLKREVFNGKKK